MRIMESDPRLAVVGQAARGDDAVRMVEEHRPDLVLMDLRMPGLNGVEAIRRIRTTHPGIAIGVLTVFDNGQLVQSALAAGANGYILKDSTPHQLTEAAVSLVQRPRGAGSGEDDPIRRLTAREVEVLRALATGASNAVIAARLGISQKTLRNHISNTYHKLEIFDRAQAVLIAARHGLVGTGPIDEATQPD